MDLTLSTRDGDIYLIVELKCVTGSLEAGTLQLRAYMNQVHKTSGTRIWGLLLNFPPSARSASITYTQLSTQ